MPPVIAARLKRGITNGCTCAFVGGLMVLVALRILNVTESPGLYVGGLGFAVLTGGLVSLRDVWFAFWGLVTKQRALRALHENLGEVWALRTDRMSPVGGDIDAFVTHKCDAKAYAIEIKSFSGVEVKPSLFSGARPLQHRNGRQLSKSVTHSLRHCVTPRPSAQYRSCGFRTLAVGKVANCSATAFCWSLVTLNG